jgi:lipopolysaccharide/colanic/teichoic acid biosynthesis glycosyltransferase
MGQRTAAAMLLLLISPALALVAVLVRVLDGKPVLFRQRRLGRDKVPFEILKFRTMAGDPDPGVTRLGAVLRRTGIDELTQLINIARGDMCFIGPRPLTEQDVARLGWDGETYATRWRVRPGLTGYAQFAPVCDKDLSWALDDQYARERSPWLDLRITLASGAVLVLGKQRVKAWMFR